MTSSHFRDVMEEGDDDVFVSEHGVIEVCCEDRSGDLLTSPPKLQRSQNDSQRSPHGSPERSPEFSSPIEKVLARGRRPFEVVLRGGSPWGFALNGGRGTNLPLYISKVGVFYCYVYTFYMLIIYVRVATNKLLKTNHNRSLKADQ